jgi:hypothetical protein
VRVNDRGAGNQHRFPCAEGGGTATRVRHKGHALTPTLPEYRGGNQTASATTGVHSHDHANKRSPKEIVPSFGSPSQLVDAELAQTSPQKSASRRSPLISSKPVSG